MAQPAPIETEEPRPTPKPLQRRSARRIALRVAATRWALRLRCSWPRSSVSRSCRRLPGENVDYTLITLVATPVLMTLFFFYGLYEPRQVLGPVNEFKAGLPRGCRGDGSDLPRGLDLRPEPGTRVGVRWRDLRDSSSSAESVSSCARSCISCGGEEETRRGRSSSARTTRRAPWLRRSNARRGSATGSSASSTTTIPPVRRRRPITRSSDTPPTSRALIEKRAGLVLVAASAFDTATAQPAHLGAPGCRRRPSDHLGTIDLMASRMIVQSVAGVPLLYVRRTGHGQVPADRKAEPRHRRGFDRSGPAGSRPRGDRALDQARF